MRPPRLPLRSPLLRFPLPLLLVLAFGLTGCYTQLETVEHRHRHKVVERYEDDERYEDERTLRTLDMIRKSAERGSEMVKQVLAFARGVEGDHVPMKAEKVVEEVERIARETFPASIRIETEIEDDLWWIAGDATQLQQVMMNLCVNARDAMPEGGALTLRAANVTLDERTAQRNLEALDGLQHREEPRRLHGRREREGRGHPLQRLPPRDRGAGPQRAGRGRRSGAR